MKKPSKDIFNLLISLLADQESVTITYEQVKENEK